MIKGGIKYIENMRTVAWNKGSSKNIRINLFSTTNLKAVIQISGTIGRLNNWQRPCGGVNRTKQPSSDLLPPWTKPPYTSAKFI